MFLDQAGEHIADIMTINRGLASIPSASSILDTSNYTFHAITFGKDATSYQYHAHTARSTSADGFITVVSYGPTTFSGYDSRTANRQINWQDPALPESFNPLQTRLESDSTVPSYLSGVPDLGHYLNLTIHPTLSSVAHLAGGFPAASGSRYKILDANGNTIISGVLASSIYNLSSIMDASGFLTFAPFDLPAQQIGYTFSEVLLDLFNYGVIRSAESTFPESVELKWMLPPAECGALNLFGGLTQLGLWCLDVKEMLSLGYNPPFSFSTLNNPRRYKLFAKRTFNRDLLLYNGNSTFKDLFQDVTGNWDDPAGFVMKWKIRFV